MKHTIRQGRAWVEQAKRHLRDLYDGRPLDRLAFEFLAHRDIKGRLDEDAALAGRSATTVDDHKRGYYDHELALDNQLKRYEQRVSGGFQDDTVVSISPLGGALGWFVEFFGATNEWFPNRPPFPYPLITRGAQIDSLKPDLSRGELFRVALEQMRYFAREVGESIPVGAPDLQSPIDQASMLMDYTNLIYLMMDEPSRAHRLLRMVTDVLVESLHAIKREMVTDWPLSCFGWWMPRGVFLSDDLMAVLSPDLYAEYARPYNEIVGREFGGVALHSCGNIRHNLENVAATEGIIALNTHETLETATAALGDRVVVITGGVREVIAPHYPGNRRDHLETGAEVEAFWWEDFGHLPEITSRRFLYQCSALLKTRTAEEAYQTMLDYSAGSVGP